MERRDLMAVNNKIYKDQGIILDKYAKKTCKSLVIANPAKTNCLALIKNAPSIPKKTSQADHVQIIIELLDNLH